MHYVKYDWEVAIRDEKPWPNGLWGYWAVGFGVTSGPDSGHGHRDLHLRNIQLDQVVVPAKLFESVREFFLLFCEL